MPKPNLIPPIEDDLMLKHMLQRCFAYAYNEYEEAERDGEVERETQFDNIFGHVRLAQVALGFNI